MAKGIGLIGNFKGKVGNMVGYKLTDSNSGNTQGIRVYQPIVKNPKTAAQAEQRAKLAPINATYRALKMVIDRGNEGLPYGNKSRLAWLKQAFKAETMPWVEKGKSVKNPVIAQLSKGSLAGLGYNAQEDAMNISCTGMTDSTSVATIGALSSALKNAYPFLKDGDQITIVECGRVGDSLQGLVHSFVIDTTSSTPQTDLVADAGMLVYNAFFNESAFAVIVSREGDNGEHLRSTASLVLVSDLATAAPYDTASKTAAIESYRSSAAVNADWAEESIQ